MNKHPSRCSVDRRGCPKMAKAIEYGDLQFGKEPVGRGGSASVYKGRWKSLDMIVAIKTSVQGIPDSEVGFQSRTLMHTKHACAMRPETSDTHS